MYDKLFAELMVIALGTMGGAGVGLVVGWLAGTQKQAWANMSRKEKMITVTLVVGFSLIFTAIVAWYSLVVYKS